MRQSCIFYSLYVVLLGSIHLTSKKKKRICKFEASCLFRSVSILNMNSVAYRMAKFGCLCRGWEKIRFGLSTSLPCLFGFLFG